MVRAVLENGVVRLTQPLPPEWEDGCELVIEAVDQVEDASRIDQLFVELQELGPARYDPGEREKIQAILDGADDQAKALVRREMGIP